MRRRETWQARGSHEKREERVRQRTTGLGRGRGRWGEALGRAEGGATSSPTEERGKEKRRSKLVCDTEKTFKIQTAQNRQTTDIREEL